MAGHLGLGDRKHASCVPADYETPGRIAVSDLAGDFQRVFLGHYHNSQQVTDRVIYAGSPIQLSFKESGQKRGFWTWDSDTDTVTFHEDDQAPRYIQVKAGRTPTYREGDRLWYKGVSPEEAEAIRERHREERVAVRVDVVRSAKSATRLPPGLAGDSLLRAYVDSVLPDADPKERADLVEIGKEIAHVAHRSS
jgi:DNA repair exonuclease SbcCD nuclease subunit